MGRNKSAEGRTVEQKRVVAYMRVSTDGQQEDGHGLDVQRQTIAAYAATERLDVSDWIEDVVSGAKEERPGLERIREMAAAGELDVVLLYKLDRLARDTRLALNIEHELRISGVRVVSVSEYLGDGPVGEMMRTIMFAFASFERAQIATRTKAGRRRAVEKNGTFSGGRGVLGYRPVGKRGDLGHGALQVVPAEAEAVRAIFELRAEGRTYQAVADELNTRGLRTFQGAEFRRMHVYRVLQREEFYRGSGVLTRSVEAGAIAHQAILSA
jgi:site-specific DNA recombinase